MKASTKLTLVVESGQTRENYLPDNVLRWRVAQVQRWLARTLRGLKMRKSKP